MKDETEQLNEAALTPAVASYRGLESTDQIQRSSLIWSAGKRIRGHPLWTSELVCSCQRVIQGAQCKRATLTRHVELLKVASAASPSPPQQRQQQPSSDISGSSLLSLSLPPLILDPRSECGRMKSFYEQALHWNKSSGPWRQTRPVYVLSSPRFLVSRNAFHVPRRAPQPTRGGEEEGIESEGAKGGEGCGM